MRTKTVCKNRIDMTPLLLLATAILMLSGCAGGGSTTAMSRIPDASYEPITVIAFNTADPYARQMQQIAPAGGTSSVFLPAKGLTR